MNRPIKLAGCLITTLAVAACNGGGVSNVPAASGQSGAAARVSDGQMTPAGRRVCTDFRVGFMHCDVLIESGKVQPDYAGWTPANYQAAYDLPSSTKGKGQLVAIVDAYDNPDVATDLAAYRSYFKLPKAKFAKYNQEGQKSNYPAGNVSWGVEIALDVEMVSATCPNCKIDLIESNDNNGNNLYAAEKEAVKLGAHVITNSWGGGAGSASGGSFNHKGVTYLASAGDGGYGMQDPADYDTVVSVGGTVLTQAGSTYSESVWSQSGAGCSVVTKPSWQTDPGCTKRTGNDVAAVAQFSAEYDTYGNPGWFTVGGTSVASPLIAGVYGLAANGGSVDAPKKVWTLKAKALKNDFNVISSGTVAKCPPSLSGSYLCTAGTGQFGTYSGPDGWGTPHGIGAF